MSITVLRASVLSGLLSFNMVLAEDPYQGDPVVVTASRANQALGQVLPSVSVIDRERIERSQAPDLLELLRLEAGIDLARGGGPGAQTSVFLRGGNSNHVLVLIDGVRVAAAGTGAFTWELLDPALIERIEIVRGPRAARWGSDAMAGVIQIFTRRQAGVGLRAGYGGDRDRNLSAAVGNRDHSLALSARRVGGFSAQNPSGFAFDPDNDGFENLGAAARGRVTVPGGALSYAARLASGDVEFDQGVSDFLNYSGALDYRLDSASPWQWSLQLAALSDRLQTETMFGRTELTTRRVQASAQGQRRIGQATRLLFGADAWRESGTSQDSWSDSRTTIGLWAGIDGRVGQVDFESSLRVDHDSRFGAELTGNLAGAWAITADWRVQASAARSFRSPNFNQLFSPGFGELFAGNPDLDPETARHIEAGTLWRIGAGQSARLNAFQTDFDDLIDFAGEQFQAINVRQARVRGLEFTHQIRRGPWLAETQFTWQDADDRNAGLPLLRRAKRKGSSQIDYLFAGGHWLGAELVYTGARQDIGQQRLDDYFLINLRAGWEISESMRIEGRADNLGDRHYQPLIGFNAPDRRIFIALNWQR